MVASSPIKFECTHYTTIRLPGNPPMGAVDVVIGKVIGIHIDEAVLTDGKIDVSKTVPIARCGYFEYAAVRETFEMRIPGGGGGGVLGAGGWGWGGGGGGEGKLEEGKGGEAEDER